MSTEGEPPTPSGDAWTPRVGTADPFAGARVLVVDDVEANVVLLQRILLDAGAAEVDGVIDARLAVDRCLELHPDLVLLDLHMPHVSGHDVLTRLRLLVPSEEFLPVVVLTADTDGAVREQALAAGANDFVTKPFDPVEVVQRVRNLVSMRAMYGEVRRRNAELVVELEAQAEARLRVAIEADARRAAIRAALAQGAPDVVFQPIVELRNGQTVAVEALARFAFEPQRAPDVWFAEAESVGLGVELELAAVRAAIARIDDIPSDLLLTVNASPMTMLSGELGACLERVPGPRVVLELTEHNRIDDYAGVLAALDGLRRQGVRIAVDDAGAGYAGLRQILQLRPDVIKLDVEITRGIDRDPVRRALASSLVTFGRDTGAFIVAEGIETGAELAVLRDLGVRWGQGFHLARPGPLPVPMSVAMRPEFPSAVSRPEP